MRTGKGQAGDIRRRRGSQCDDQNDLGSQGETAGRGATWGAPQAYFRGGKETGNEGPRHEKCVLGMQSTWSTWSAVGSRTSRAGGLRACKAARDAAAKEAREARRRIGERRDWDDWTQEDSEPPQASLAHLLSGKMRWK